MKQVVQSIGAILFVISSAALAPMNVESGIRQSGNGFPELAEPISILAAGEPISVDVGHAAPYVYDYNKDGLKDLIVGQFGGGKARIYLNRGTDAEPVFDGFTYLQAAGEDAATNPG